MGVGFSTLFDLENIYEHFNQQPHLVGVIFSTHYYLEKYEHIVGVILTYFDSHTESNWLLVILLWNINSIFIVSVIAGLKRQNLLIREHSQHTVIMPWT